MQSRNNRNSLKDCFLNRRIAVSVLVAAFVMVGLASPGIAQASADVVLVMHFDEGSGTIVKDESGHGNDGTIYGASWTTGVSGKALSFDGMDDYVDIGNIGITDNWTVSFWAKSDSVSKVVYYTIGTGGTDKGIGMGGTYHTISNDFYVFEGSTVLHGGPSVITGTWYYVTIIKNGLNYEIYVNGNSATSGNLRDIDITDLNIGRRSDDFFYFDGIIDEVAIYSRALTPEEIKAHYLALAPQTPPPKLTPFQLDSDGDGWSDEKEREMGSNPYSIDSDADGLKDPEDPNPTVPEKKTPGFEIVFATVGLLAVAYLLIRRK